MKLFKFIHDMDFIEMYNKVENPENIPCYAVREMHKKTVCYPITSITVTSTSYMTRIILNATYNIGKEPLSLKQLNFELKEISRYLINKESRCSIFLSLKRSSRTPIAYYTIPGWSRAIKIGPERICFIKLGSTNSILSKEMK